MFRFFPSSAAALAALCCLHGAAAAPAASGAALRADGTRFALSTGDGKVQYSADLVGAILHLADGSAVRIDAVEAVEDARHKTIWRHTLSTQDADGQWVNFCTPHPDGSQVAMLVPGREMPDATLADDPDHFALTCSSGAQGKCISFGYRPWERVVDGLDQRAAYNACVHMVRADYGGEGRAYTENGKLIDVFDDAGIQTPDMLPDQDFEAGWGPRGAVCVRHTRVARNVTLAQLAARYPALRGQVGPHCTIEYARARGALLFNRSDPRGALPGASGAKPAVPAR
ncbi:MAG: ADYC domain-containing protein [Pseudomonadota bacterium]